jgi:hypothetical protein
MCSLKEYTNSRLKRLAGSFKIYKNKEGKYLHISDKANIKVDLNFWKYVKTVKK